MDRRTLLRRLSLGLAGATLASEQVEAAGAAPDEPRPPARAGRLKLGCQKSPTTEELVQSWARFGVTHVCGCPEDRSPERGYWTVEELAPVRDLCEAAGLVLEMVWEPFLRSSHIDGVDRPAIMLGESPDRDRDIECFQKHIENCAAVGVKAVKYNLSIIGKPRTRDTPGRGGSRYSTWKLSEAGDRARGITRAGRVTADMYWERIAYFLERVVPVAEQHEVRLACHPQDPGVPPGYQGVDSVLGTVAGLKQFVSIRESPYHGLNFCQGTVSEMLQDPGREIMGVIRHFGSQGKIFNVHFRNIRGKRDSFQETYPDEGDIDFLKAMLVYKEVGYSGMMMPDHVPHHPDDRTGMQAFAFAYGYIKALIKAADAMA